VNILLNSHLHVAVNDMAGERVIM